MLRIRLTIPQNWKLILQDKELENHTDEKLYKKLHNLKNLKTKDIYWMILPRHHDCSSHANTINNWKTKYNYDDDEIIKVFKLPYTVTSRTDLQALQYKITYKIINCNYWLHKIQIVDSPICRFCDKEETIEHFFYACKVTKQYWKAFQTWWIQVTGQDLPVIQEKQIILGFLNEEPEYKVLNRCILIGKAMIYRIKNQNVQPDIYIFHCDLKEYISIERGIATDISKLNKLEDEWGDILDI
jgi:hypothetical protein